MPFYSYRAKNVEQSCQNCAEEFDCFQKINEMPVETCPECGNQVVRIMHATPTVKDSSEKKTLSDDNLKKHGFKKFVNRGHGKGYDEVV
ncbi:MAG: hypothetical protein HQM10_05670 [Candidatus Riflebacteria bacterium]|nr:hypothetical protein [Candidatus Riflebacteria bacterium]